MEPETPCRTVKGVRTPDANRDLRRLIRAAHQDAFAVMFRAEAGAVFTVAHRLTGDWATAEDVTSDTFLTAWRTRMTLSDDERDLRPWLLAIAARQALNSRRTLRRRLALFDCAPRPPIIEDFSDDAAQRLDDAATLARTARAVALLTRPEAEVLALCVWSNLTYQEAAETLCIPVGTVRSRLSRARAHLRELADPQDRDSDAHHPRAAADERKANQ